MFCVIMGVFIVVGSDSTQTYHVAVRKTDPISSFTNCQRADIGADCRILGSRLDVRAILDQYPSIFLRWRKRSIGGWLHLTLDGHGMSACELPHNPMLTNPRSSGSFTSAQRHKQRTEATLTPSPYTRSSAIQHATADRLALILRTTATRRPRQATMHLRCTHPLNSTASRLHRLYRATLVVSQVNNRSPASDKVQGPRHPRTRHQQP